MLQGGVQPRRTTAQEAAVAATASPPATGQPVPDGGQSIAPPENVVQGALAGTSWTHDDVLVAMSVVSTVAIVTWMVMEVSKS